MIDLGQENYGLRRMISYGHLVRGCAGFFRWVACVLWVSLEILYIWLAC